MRAFSGVNQGSLAPRGLGLWLGAAALGLICGAGIGGGASQAQEYVLPAEQAAKEAIIPDPDKVVGAQVAAGRLEIVQIPVENLGRATVITSHPEVADVHVEDPGLLFIFGRTPGETIVVIADEKKDPVYTTKVTVFLPEDQGG